MDLLPGVTSHVTETDRLRMHWLQSGPEDGVPVVLVHGNLSTSRFFEHLLPGAPDRFRFVVPDMRSPTRVTIANRPSDKTERRVANGLAVVKQCNP